MMNTRQLLSLLVILPLCQSVSAMGPTTAAMELLDELVVRESRAPLRDQADWQKPARIVLVNAMIARSFNPSVRKRLQAAAGDARLHVFDSAEAAAEELKRADVLLGPCELVDESLTDIRWVQHFAAGVETCDGIESFESGEVMLSNMKGVYGPGIAETVVAMVMSLARGLHVFHRAQASSNWDRGIAREYPMMEVKGKTLLVVGLGGIGSQIAWRANALGMKVIATRNSSRQGPDYVEYVGLAAELHELAARADFIVNATPLTPATTGLFDAEFFSHVKKSAYFLNIGRGKSVDTEALVKALEEGRLAGAALDVTEPEPLPSGHPLWKMDNVIITPHISGFSDRITDRFWTFIAENLRRYVQGEALLNQVNFDRGY